MDHPGPPFLLYYYHFTGHVLAYPHHTPVLVKQELELPPLFTEEENRGSERFSFSSMGNSLQL